MKCLLSDSKAALFASWTVALAVLSGLPDQVRAQNAQTVTEEALQDGSSDLQYTRALAVFRQAKTQEARFQAARKIAAVKYAQNNRLAAQWWLRRAANYAPDREWADRNRADFQAIRQEARLRPAFSFQISPSDNINNGVEDRIFSLGNILLVFPTSALALSGVEYTAQASVDLRLSESRSHRTSVDASFFGRTYSLSEESKRLAPTVKGSDYALVQLAFGLNHSRQLHPDWGPTQLRFGVGQLWSGGEELRQFHRLDLTQTLPVVGQHRFAAGVFVERQHPLRSGQPVATLWGGTISSLHLLSWGDQIKTSLSRQYYEADIATFTYRGTELRLSYHLAEPVWTLGVSLHANLSTKTYDEFSLSLDGRRDRGAEIGATAVFNEMAVFGFSPSITVTMHRTWSNVDRFDIKGAAASLGFASRF